MKYHVVARCMNKPGIICDLICSFFIPEFCLTTGAFPVLNIARCRTCGSLSLNFRYYMAGCLNDPGSLNNLICSTRITERLGAGFAGPVSRIALLSTGCSRGHMGCHIMAQCSSIPGVFFDLCFPGYITEYLLAGQAHPVFSIPRLRTCLIPGNMMFHTVARCSSNPGALLNLRFPLCVTEWLPASFAGPVSRIARFSACAVMM